MTLFQGDRNFLLAVLVLLLLIPVTCNRGAVISNHMNVVGDALMSRDAQASQLWKARSVGFTASITKMISFNFWLGVIMCFVHRRWRRISMTVVSLQIAALVIVCIVSSYYIDKFGMETVIPVQ